MRIILLSFSTWIAANGAALAAFEHLDSSIIRLLAALDETGLRDHTLVVFRGENGGSTAENNATHAAEIIHFPPRNSPSTPATVRLQCRIVTRVPILLAL